ncbi:rhodanese-like domain-containing protein [Aquimarina sp. I32.4]|uniref:rhodanese-like domain-containing protein n=1 Tax=Aquimarina sp. I32.4 TaxID=2053903 RepID=UPI000CDEB458|nr:rhodanese-like domain-containing protein [Aquimarina sp. I32.4]
MNIRIIYILLLIGHFGNAQSSLDTLLNTHNNNSIPYISVNELKAIQDTVILFDAREKKEYQISHLENAIHVGYNHFSIAHIIQQNIPKNAHIVVYCSLGIRSENISEHLKKAGYTNVHNLYGGIFAWKNNDYPVLNNKNQVTDKVHTYSKEWSKWLYKGKKVY